jgi:hypothetical protein
VLRRWPGRSGSCKTIRVSPTHSVTFRIRCRALGYDPNTVEFAAQDGAPCAIDFLNRAPNADFNSVGTANFDWIVDAVAELANARAPKARHGCAGARYSPASSKSGPQPPLP